jgi:hypothetical protein
VRSAKRRPTGYYLVAGLDLRDEMEWLSRLPALGGPGGPLSANPPALTVRRSSRRPRSRLGFAIPDEWRISVTAFPGQRRGDAQETLLHELVHLVVGASPGTRRWHGPEFKATMRRAMREAYGVRRVRVTSSYHGAYADELERRRARESAMRSTAPHPGQLRLVGNPRSSR